MSAPPLFDTAFVDRMTYSGAAFRCRSLPSSISITQLKGHWFAALRGQVGSKDKVANLIARIGDNFALEPPKSLLSSLASVTEMID